MSFLEIKNKVLSSDLKSLFYKGTNTEIHPADVADSTAEAISKFKAYDCTVLPVLRITIWQRFNWYNYGPHGY